MGILNTFAARLATLLLVQIGRTGRIGRIEGVEGKTERQNYSGQSGRATEGKNLSQREGESAGLAESQALPLAVRRYFWRRLLGLWGMVIAIRPA